MEEVGPPPSQAHALLQTRCGCQRAIMVPDPPPKMISVNLTKTEPAQESETRQFSMAGTTLANDGQGNEFLVYIYNEAVPERRRIIVPGLNVQGLKLA